ncbi:MAG: hypothetical protein A2538_02000 [Candidatus Magasanikbacteria bacterium RIFOXYD2_FULL_41_14]|uniref:Schlafen AlbA-2 domain-containing protein n=1 Tax=Candidatus Magasanikbacteria bacterium RIFOXYD2_FULL_41_14 TaxID=1798709 RepID=A0A1F6PD11_9BACT|nr:MAG: hypothetical protein A2538_02000 [Candidatus Magasanikbacteria bacterium RIFOXYD2_FULL_41_14]
MNKSDFLKLCQEFERENLEFKSAINDFSIFGGKEKEKRCLFGYCVAIGNCGGGKIIFGVSNNKEIVGTNAFSNLADIRSQIYSQLKAKIDIQELNIEGKRVLVVSIPDRQKGQLFNFFGKYLTRVGEELVEMKESEIKTILNETQDDYSAKFLNLGMEVLDENALSKLKEMYKDKNRNNVVQNLPMKQFLTDLGLLKGNKINNAALLLLGKEVYLRDVIPNAEIIFEYRNNPGDIKYADRLNLRKPMIFSLDELWKKINDRNYVIQLREGLFRRDINAYNEEAVREAILNAVVHRDYELPSSVFILQDNAQVTFKNPGGFLSGITPQNIYKKTAWRNRRLAETFEKIGLVERSGQGADLIFESSIKEGKGIPNYFNSSDAEVILQISAIVKDAEFVSYLDQITAKRGIILTVDDLIMLETIKDQDVGVTNVRRNDVEKFIDVGVVTSIGRGRGTKYFLAKQYYKDHNLLGKYTKITGLSREKYKEMILKHITENNSGSIMEFSQAFPELSSKDVTNILQEIRRSGRIKFTGNKRSGRWLLDNN